MCERASALETNMKTGTQAAHQVDACNEPRRKRVYTPLSVNVLSNQNMPHETMPLPEIHNIVSTSKIICIPPCWAPHHKPLPSSLSDCEAETGPAYINLEAIHEDIQSSHYDKKRFAAITIRIEDPTVTALLFTSGRLVITGSKCWYECMLASLIIVQMIKEVRLSARSLQTGRKPRLYSSTPLDTVSGHFPDPPQHACLASLHLTSDPLLQVQQLLSCF